MRPTYYDALEASHCLNNAETVVNLLLVDLDFQFVGNAHDHIVHLIPKLRLLSLPLHVVDEFDCGCVLQPRRLGSLAQEGSEICCGELVAHDGALSLQHPRLSVWLSL